MLKQFNELFILINSCPFLSAFVENILKLVEVVVHNCVYLLNSFVEHRVIITVLFHRQFSLTSILIDCSHIKRFHFSHFEYRFFIIGLFQSIMQRINLKLFIEVSTSGFILLNGFFTTFATLSNSYINCIE